MSTPPFTAPQVAGSKHDQRSESSDRYASTAQSRASVRSGAQLRRARLEAADMISANEAAELIGASGVTVNAWIRAGRCIGVSNRRNAFKLPCWQFKPVIWPVLQPLAKCLGTSDGWQLLSFLETPSGALDGLTPRMTLEQGVPVDRILALATSAAH